MADSVQFNVNVLPQTKERVKQIALETFRNPGDVIDWLVDQAWRDMHPSQVETKAEDESTLPKF